MSNILRFAAIVSIAFVLSANVANSSSLGTAILGDGPVSYWSFDESASGTGTAFDSVGGNNGTFQGGATRTTGLVGTGAALFNHNNGVNVGPGVGNNFSMTTGITLEAIIKPGAALGTQTYEEVFRKNDGGDLILFSFQDNATILSLGLNTAGYGELDMPLNGTNNGVRRVFLDTPGAQRVGDVVLRDGKSHHVVGTYNETTGSKRIYVDGVLAHTQALAPATQITSGGVADAFIGAQTGGGEPFNGVIDEVAVYDGALTQAQLRNHSILGGVKTSIVLSSEVLGGGIKGDTYSGGAVEIVRNVPTGTGVGVPYTSNVVGPTLDIPNFLPLGGPAGGLGSNIHGRGSLLFAPGDGETTATNNGGIGIGAHGTWLVTFDLNDLRTELGGTLLPLQLTGRYGQNGQGNPGEPVDPAGISQGIVYLDGSPIFTSGLKSISTASDLINLSITTGQYLTFVIASGDASTFFDDGTFRDLLITVVPEPSSICLIGTALVALTLKRRRRS